MNITEGETTKVIIRNGIKYETGTPCKILGLYQGGDEDAAFPVFVIQVDGGTIIEAWCESVRYKATDEELKI